MRILIIIMAFMLNMLCSEASEINFNNINAGGVQEFHPQEDENFITFNVGDHTIKFPKDGKQPDIKDAVEWSCAKISDKQITNWYLKMFGIIDRDGEQSTDDARYIKAGFNVNIRRDIDDSIPEEFNRKENLIIELKASNTCKDLAKVLTRYKSEMIRFDYDYDYDKCDDKTDDELFREEFIYDRSRITGCRILTDIPEDYRVAFEKIASNHIGRMLLYRLLLEIRCTKDNNGDCIELEHSSFSRNWIRSLFIEGAKASSFDRLEKKINLVQQSEIAGKIVISYVAGNINFKEETQSDCSVTLFHEMLHWLHALVNPSRYYSYKYGSSVDAFEIYYGNQSQKLIDELNVWRSNEENSLKIAEEEVRAILGVPVSYIASGSKFVFGDELSENMYRQSIGLQPRFGHAYMDEMEIPVNTDDMSERQPSKLNENRFAKILTNKLL